MYSQEDILKKVNELAKMYVECLKRSRYSKDEKNTKREEYDVLIKDIYRLGEKKNNTKKKYNKLNGNRWSAKKFFLTIPKTDAPKREVLEYYLNKMNISKAAIAREYHKDGTKHLHLYIEFIVKKDIKNTTYFNLPDRFSKYGNINVNIDTIKKKTKENIYSYMCKTDKKVYSYGFNIRKDAYGKLKKKEIWYKIAIGEWSLRDYILYDPSILGSCSIKKLDEMFDDNMKYIKRYFGIDPKDFLW